MRCDEFEKILEQELTDPYPETAAMHLDACESCRNLAVELRAIRMAGHALAEQDAEELEVPEHVWTALRRQLREEGILREAVVREHARASWWNLLRRPAFGGAALSLLAVAGWMVAYQRTIGSEVAAHVRREVPAVLLPSPQVATSSVASESVPDELQSDLNETVSGLPRQDATLVNALQRDMNLIDSSIAICEKSVREQPGNEMAREYLYGAYQQKAELLDAAMSRSMTGGLQ